MSSESEYRKELRKTRKALQRCILCSKQDAYTLNNRSLCFECNEKHNERNKQYRKRNKEKLLESSRKEKQYRRENHLCLSCGRLAQNGKSQCACCIIKQKKRYVNSKQPSNKITKDEAYAKGLCTICKTEKHKKDYKVCDVCYERCLSNLKRD